MKDLTGYSFLFKGTHGLDYSKTGRRVCVSARDQCIVDLEGHLFQSRLDVTGKDKEHRDLQKQSKMSGLGITH